MSFGEVHIKLLTGTLYRVTLDPPVSRLRRIRPFMGFDKACGFACRYAVALKRQMVDDTGRLTAEQCDALVTALAAEAA